MVMTVEKTRTFHQRLQGVVEARLAETKQSARQVSLAVVGHDSLIRDLRAGRIPSADRLEALFDYLGLEFYLGPTRERVEPSEAPVEIDGEAFAALPLYNVRLSAGPGTGNGDDEVIHRLAFRREYLMRRGIEPAQACLVRVRGDSMEPTLFDDDLVLIDQSRTEGIKGRVYALVDVSGDTRVKRLDRPNRSTLVLRSDNPDHAVELRQGPDLERLRIIGEVRWSGHTWR